MKTHKYIVILSLLLAFCGPTSLAIADGHWSDDWKITYMGKAKSTGTISFQLTFQAGEDFAAVLGEDNFKISQSWGENVIVKARGDTPDLSLELISSSVQGISIVIND